MHLPRIRRWRTPRSCAPAGASRCRTRRCGSCARPAGRCRSTASCARASRCSTPAARPDLVTEITLQPVRRHGVDAAILFSDIVVPLKAVGVDLDIVPGVGPVVAQPIRTRADLDQLRPLEPGDVGVRRRGGRGCWSPSSAPTPLIGFAGAPFTLASYLVEGGPSRNHENTKALMYGDPGAVARPAAPARRHHRRRSCGCRSRPAPARCSCSTRGSGRCRRPTTPTHVHAALGAPCWPRSATLGVPRIHFGVGTGELLGADGRGRRRRRRRRLPGAARRGRAAGRAGPRAAGQPRPGRRSSRPGTSWPRGPARSWPPAGPRPGHVFNLGHGVIPETDPDVLTRIVDLVHERRRPADRRRCQARRRPAATARAPGRSRTGTPTQGERDQERQQRAEHGQRDQRRPPASASQPPRSPARKPRLVRPRPAARRVRPARRG